MKRILKSLWALQLLGLSACSAEDSAVGAAGPAGEDGVNGMDAPAAETGVDGEDGMDAPPAEAGEDGSDGIDGIDGIDGVDGLPAGPPSLIKASTDSWASDNRDRLNEMVTELGIASDGFDPERPPVAVFDWDNTVIKNDIADATSFWMVQARHAPAATQASRLAAPPVADDREGAAALNAACGAALQARRSVVPTRARQPAQQRS